MADGERGPDSRPAWLEERICLSLKCKAALFKKLMEAEGANRPLFEFLNNTDAAHVFLTEAATGKELLCSDQPPAKHEEYRGEGMMQIAMNTLCQCQGQKISGTYEYVSTRPYQRARLLVPQHLSPPLLLPTRVPVRRCSKTAKQGQWAGWTWQTAW